MSGKTLFVSLVFTAFTLVCAAQDLSSTADLFKRDDENAQLGKLTIDQDPAIDTLINRYILYNRGIGGIKGFRIQIYSSSDKNAKEESGKIIARFTTEFPNMPEPYVLFDKPAYYKIRVGNYRSRVEGTKNLLMIRKVFPDAYLVPDIINFQD